MGLDEAACRSNGVPRPCAPSTCLGLSGPLEGQGQPGGMPVHRHGGTARQTGRAGQRASWALGMKGMRGPGARLYAAGSASKTTAELASGGGGGILAAPRSLRTGPWSRLVLLPHSICEGCFWSSPPIDLCWRQIPIPGWGGVSLSDNVQLAPMPEHTQPQDRAGSGPLCPREGVGTEGVRPPLRETKCGRLSTRWGWSQSQAGTQDLCCKDHPCPRQLVCLDWMPPRGALVADSIWEGRGTATRSRPSAVPSPDPWEADPGRTCQPGQVPARRQTAAGKTSSGRWWPREGLQKSAALGQKQGTPCSQWEKAQPDTWDAHHPHVRAQ